MNKPERPPKSNASGMWRRPVFVIISSFPSDHASAAFGIAFAVLCFDRLAGSIFLAAAFVIGVGRVFVGVHYPLDIVAGFFVGSAAALLVTRLGRPLLERLVGLVERLTDPLLAPLWNRLRPAQQRQ